GGLLRKYLSTYCRSSDVLRPQTYPSTRWLTVSVRPPEANTTEGNDCVLASSTTRPKPSSQIEGHTCKWHCFRSPGTSWISPRKWIRCENQFEATSSIRDLAK